jgi:nicotinamidase-related amidase
VLDEMRELSRKKARIGVLIIDVQTLDPRGALVESSRVDQGLHVKYDSHSVLQNQADVVGLARELKIPIFNVNASPSIDIVYKTVSELTSQFPENNKDVHDFTKRNNNALGEPAFLEMLLKHLGADAAGNRYLVVMGFNANQCVQETVFGNDGRADYSSNPGSGSQLVKGFPKTKGLLEHGFTVVTARTKLY